MWRFVSCCLLIAAASSAGCNDFGSTSSTDSNAAEGANSATVTVSVNAPGTSELPFDGAAVGGGETVNDDVHVLLDTLRALASHALPKQPGMASKMRRKRAVKAVALASKALQLVIDDASKSMELQEVVTFYLEARFQLAVDGSDDDVDQLYADVQALNDRDPKSKSAAEGIYYLARFAHTKARSSESDDPVWFENFSRWSRQFAHRFPDQKNRTVKLLFGAARSCELNSMAANTRRVSERLLAESRQCYTILVEEFSQTSQGQEAAAVLRRLSLPGRKLSQFTRLTLDGSYLTPDDFAGHITLAYFWEVASDQFRNKMLPVLKQADDASEGKLRFVGVNLDADETVVRRFVKANGVPGRQLFSKEESLRSWNSPLIRFWGISHSPSVWLIDRDGVVRSVDLTASKLVAQMVLLVD